MLAASAGAIARRPLDMDSAMAFKVPKVSCVGAMSLRASWFAAAFVSQRQGIYLRVLTKRHRNTTADDQIHRSNSPEQRFEMVAEEEVAQGVCGKEERPGGSTQPENTPCTNKSLERSEYDENPQRLTDAVRGYGSGNKFWSESYPTKFDRCEEEDGGNGCICKGHESDVVVNHEDTRNTGILDELPSRHGGFIRLSVLVEM